MCWHSNEKSSAFLPTDSVGFSITGTSRNHDGDPNETELVAPEYKYILLVLLRDYSNSFNFITMWPIYLITEQVGKAFKLIQRMNNLPLCTHVLHKTLNLFLSRCCLAEYGEQMYQTVSAMALCCFACLQRFCDVLVAVVVVASETP